MRFDVGSVSEAEQMLRELNALQDSFIKRLELVSHDDFEEPGAQNCTGLIDLRIVFMHFNFGDRSRVKAIDATFTRVSDVRLGTSGQTFEWHVSSLEVAAGERPLFGEKNEPCLVAEINSPKRANALKPTPALLFRFDRAIVSTAD